MSQPQQNKQNMLVLGNSRSAPYTHAQFSKDVQVYHLVNHYHPQQIYNGISKNFVQSIEIKDNPSDIYNKKMKNIYMDELDSSLNQYKNRLNQMKNDANDFRKDYKQNVNGVLLYMQNQENRRNEALRNTIKKQQEHQKRFIDANLIKNNRIDKFIAINEFPNRLQMARSQFLANNCSPNSPIKQYGQLKKNRRTVATSQDEYIRKQNSQTVIKNQNINQNTFDIAKKGYNYKLNFNHNSIEDKKILRVHNPITNPIEYHIDNPYFIKKMQKKEQLDIYNPYK